MERALALPEVVESVIAFTPRHTQTQCARVSRYWNELALNCVWAILDRLDPLLERVGPLKYKNKNDYIMVFAGRAPNKTEWKKLLPYARRVRSLNLEASRTVSHLHENVFSAFMSFAVGKEIFPRLRYLMIDARLPTAFLQKYSFFLNPKITSLNVTFDLSETSTVDEASRLLTLIGGSLPNIQHLVVLKTGYTSSIDITRTLSDFLDGLQYLTTFTASRLFFSAQTMSALARLPKLKSVISDHEEYTCWQLEVTTNFAPCLSVDAFQSLSTLSLSISLEDLCCFFESTNAPRALTALKVQETGYACPAFIRRFIMSLPITLQFRDLFLDFRVGQFVETQRHHIDFDDIEGLLRFQRLEKLEIHHTNFIYINDDQVMQIVNKLPRIKGLVLNPDPTDCAYKEMPLTSGILGRIGIQKTHLEYLSLCFDARKMSLNDWPASHVSENLQLMRLGIGIHSPIDHACNFAQYLWQILPDSCQIDLVWPHNSGTRERTCKDDSELSECPCSGGFEKWSKVARARSHVKQAAQEVIQRWDNYSRLEDDAARVRWLSAEVKMMEQRLLSQTIENTKR